MDDKVRKYHLEMMLAEVNAYKYPNKGDTRNYLSLDMGERDILKELLERELNVCK